MQPPARRIVHRRLTRAATAYVIHPQVKMKRPARRIVRRRLTRAAMGCVMHLAVRILLRVRRIVCVVMACATRL